MCNFHVARAGVRQLLRDMIDCMLHKPSAALNQAGLGCISAGRQRKRNSGSITPEELLLYIPLEYEVYQSNVRVSFGLFRLRVVLHII